MAGADNFRLSIAQWQQATQEKLDALARVSVQDLCEAVVDDTPVDTGFLVNNWQPSLDAPVIAEATGHADPGAGDTAGRIAAIIPELKAGDLFYMTNNTEYAKFVEYGTSKMAGRFYVARNVANWQNIAAAAAVKVGLTE